MKNVIGYRNLAVGDVLVNEKTAEPFELISTNSRFGFLSNGEKFHLSTDKIVGKDEYVSIAPPAVEDAWKHRKVEENRNKRDAVLEAIDRFALEGIQKWSIEDCDVFLSIAKKYS